jgi:putative restriction endonuclease
VNYWWVSQNKTFDHEVGGGYLWSPITNNAGQRNAAYDHMTEIRAGDVVFSFAGMEIRAVGVALGSAYEAEKPTVFGAAGETWSATGWRVPVEFTPMDSPIRPSQHMEVLEPLLPTKYSPIRPNGVGNQQYLFPVPEPMAVALLVLLGNPYLPTPSELLAPLDPMQMTAEDREILSEPLVAETEKQALVQARRGQGLFRSRVRAFEPRCRVTSVSSDKLLIASHIKPWKASTNQERLDGNNGLFLSPHIDKLFDGGFISFSAKGTMRVSPLLDREVMPKWHIDSTATVGAFSKDQAYFLEYHAHVQFKI